MEFAIVEVFFAKSFHQAQNSLISEECTSYYYTSLHTILHIAGLLKFTGQISQNIVEKTTKLECGMWL